MFVAFIVRRVKDGDHSASSLVNIQKFSLIYNKLYFKEQATRLFSTLYNIGFLYIVDNNNVANGEERERRLHHLRCVVDKCDVLKCSTNGNFDNYPRCVVQVVCRKYVTPTEAALKEL